MAVEDLTATRVGTVAVPENGMKSSLKFNYSTIEVSASASVSSTYTLIDIPSGAKITGLSRLYWDDMATSGSPTLDLGVTGDSVTLDDDVINDGLALSSASTGTPIVKSIDNYGKPLWELAGLTSDPGEVWQLVGTIRDAAVVAGGTLVCEAVYTTD